MSQSLFKHNQDGLVLTLEIRNFLGEWVYKSIPNVSLYIYNDNEFKKFIENKKRGSFIEYNGNNPWIVSIINEKGDSMEFKVSNYLKECSLGYNVSTDTVRFNVIEYDKILKTGVKIGDIYYNCLVL